MSSECARQPAAGTTPCKHGPHGELLFFLMEKGPTFHQTVALPICHLQHCVELAQANLNDNQKGAVASLLGRLPSASPVRGSARSSAFQYFSRRRVHQGRHAFPAGTPAHTSKHTSDERPSSTPPEWRSLSGLSSHMHLHNRDDRPKACKFLKAK